MRWSKIFILIFFVLFHLILIKFWPSEIKSLAGIFFFIYELTFLICFFLTLYKGYSVFLNTLMLLLFVNLFTDNISFNSKYNISSHLKSLEPNHYNRLEVIGDVMPGFSGVNTLSTDSKGYRTTKKIVYDDANKYRIFSVGGSTTVQVYVDDKETWTAHLENFLEANFNEGIETINTGVSGLRAVNHLATLKYTESFHPDLYLFLVGVNDWNNHIVSSFKNIRRTLLYYFLNRARVIINFKNDSFSETKKNIIEKVNGDYYSSQNNSLEKNDRRTLNLEDVSKDYKIVMNKIAKKCNENNYKCMFITQPTAYSVQINEELRSRLWMTPPNQNYTLDLKSLIQISNLYNYWLRVFSDSNNLLFCDLANKIEPSIKFLYDDVHFNENGSKKVAKVIAECINHQLLK